MKKRMKRRMKNEEENEKEQWRERKKEWEKEEKLTSSETSMGVMLALKGGGLSNEAKGSLSLNPAWMVTSAGAEGVALQITTPSGPAAVYGC